MADLFDAVRVVPDFPEEGVQFQDLTPLLADPARLSALLDRVAAPWGGASQGTGRRGGAGVTHVVGIESRGFWLGPALALRLGAGFVPCRKPGKLPAATISARYALEYGEDALELHADALGPGDRVLVHDDVIATGGTAAAACALVRDLGAVLVGVSVIVEIAALAGRAQLPEGIPVEAARTV